MEEPEGGYYLVRGKVRAEKEVCGARVLVHYANRKDVLVLPVSKGGTINHMVEVRKGAKLLRVEIPLPENGKVIEEITMRRVSFLGRIYRFYRRVLPLFLSRNPLTKRLKRTAGLSLFDVVLKPRESYYRVSYARYRRICSFKDYGEWVGEYVKKEEEALAKLKRDYGVRFLIVVLRGGSSEEHLQRTLLSVSRQEYSRVRVVVGYRKDVERILRSSDEDYVMFLEEGDVLSVSALLCFARVAEEAYPDVVYSDNDFLGEDGERRCPFFKPSWSPDYFLEFDYVQSPVAFRRELLRDVEEFSTNYEIILSLLKIRNLRIVHIPALLLTKARRDEENRKITAVREFLGERGEVLEGPIEGTRRVVYRVDSFPKVSIVIPTGDSYDLLRRCIKSLLSITDYPEYEVLIVDNGSKDGRVWSLYRDLEGSGKVKVLRAEFPFNFSKMVNLGVRSSRGGIVCLLNNDTEIIHKEWLKEMVSHALRKEVGVVGAKLVYPNGTVQHGGVVMGIWNGTDHAFKGIPEESPGYMNRLITLQNYLAVTGACMVFRREVFEEVGGFDERLAVNFNDVDFCLKVYERGYRVVWTPRAKLIHLESASRGQDPDTARREIEILRRRWGKYIEGDPFYNPNLTVYRTDFSLSGEVVFEVDFR